MATKKTKVEVYGETSKYERSMRNVKRTSRSTSHAISGHWSKVFGTLTKLSAMFGIAGASGFVLLGKNAIEAGDLIHKLNLRLGLSTESLSQLQHAANLSGVEFNAVAKSFQKMQENISDAGRGIGEAKDALEQLGLDARQLQNLSPERQLETIADALLGVANQSDKVRIAADIFGARGVQMLQLMSKGAAGIRGMREEADRLGITLSQDAAQAIADANDAMTRVKTSISGVTRTMIIELAPAIGGVADEMAAWVAQNRELIGQGTHEAIDKITSSVKALKSIYDKLPDGIIGAAGIGLVGRMMFGGPTGGFLALMYLADKQLSKMGHGIGRIKSDIVDVKTFWDATMAGMHFEDYAGFFGGGEPSGGAGGAFGPIKLNIRGPGQTRGRGEAEGYQQLTDNLLGLSVLRGEQMLELDMVQAELLAGQQMAMATTALEAKSRLETYMAGTLYNDLESMRWNHAQRMMVIEEQEKQMKIVTAQNWLQTTMNVGNAVMAFSGKQSKAIFAIAKGAEVAKATMAAFAASTMALAHPPGPPSTIPLAKSVLAMGLANAAAIGATAIGTMKGGGTSGGAVGTYSASPATGLPAIPSGITETQSKVIINLNIEGDMVTDEGYIEMLAEKLSSAVQNRDVTLISSNAIQADQVI